MEKTIVVDTDEEKPFARGGVVAAPEQPAPELDAEPPALPQPAIRKVMVVFDFMRQDGFKGTQRIFVNGVADLRTQADVEHVERMIAENGAFVSVIITNWKPLEG